MNDAIEELRIVRKQMKILEVKEKALKEKVCAYMGEREELIDTDGLVAVVWGHIGESKRLDGETVKLIYPEVYYECLATIPGGRRFVVK